MNSRKDAQIDPNDFGKKRQGCGPVLLIVIAALWVIALSALNLFSTWSLEQTLFEDAHAISDLRWIFQAVYAVLLVVPLILLYSLVKAPRLKIIYRLWLIAAIFSVLCVPIKLVKVTAQQETAVFQILVLGISVLVLKIFQKERPSAEGPSPTRNENFGITALVGGALALPWVLYGALGSWEDTLLFLLAGFLFGYFVSEIIYPFLLDFTQHRGRELSTSDFLLDGFALVLFLLILVTGLSVNGSQVVLTIVVPAAGWLLSAFSINSRGTRGRGKLSTAIIAGLAFCLPLIWFDMDELFLLISSTPGETFGWATQAGWISLMVTVAAIFLVLLSFEGFKKLKLSKRVNQVMIIGLAGALVAIYFLYGQVGWFGERFFVILTQQADLSGIDQNADISTKRAQVYSSLVSTAEKSQSALRAGLDARHIRYTPYYLVNALEVRGGIFTRVWVASQPVVDRILESPILRPLPEPLLVSTGNSTTPPARPSWNISLIGADRVWIDFAVTGKGIIIGQSDSGVDGAHVQLAPSYRGIQSGDAYNWFDPWNHTKSPTDIGGHGTATLGLIVGKDIGIAPEAQWMACVNLARNLGNPAHYLDCMQFMLAPYLQNGNAFSDGDPSQGAMVLNNSWGCPTVEGCDAQVYQSAVAALDAAGIFVTSAAGNTGYYGCGTVTDPLAIYADVFTAGSINQSGALSFYSSLGPVIVDGSNRIKPDIAAPGEGIESSSPQNTYQTASGTSFAGPHVAGVVALMWSANPGLIGKTALTRQLLEQTATQMTQTIPQCAATSSGPNNAVGYGILNAYDAVKAAMAAK